MSVLLSIKPKYIEQIKNGSKQYEFRRVIFKKDIDEIYVYATAPVKQIVGKICIDKIIKDCPQNLWCQFRNKAGITQQDFFEYFSGKENGYAIKIKYFILFDKPIDPYEGSQNFIPPQSYVYLDNVSPQINKKCKLRKGCAVDIKQDLVHTCGFAHFCEMND